MIVRMKFHWCVSCRAVRAVFALAVVFTCGGVLSLPAMADVWYVAPAPTGDDGNAGSAEKPFATINHAIASAAEGDEIRIQAGTNDVTLVKAYATSDIDDYPRKGRRPDVGCYQHRYVKGLNLLIR